MNRPDEHILVGVGDLDRLFTESSQLLEDSFSLPLSVFEKAGRGDLFALASGELVD